MTPRQIKLSLEDAEAGMVLSHALVDANGSTLLPQGAELTDAVLKSLQRRGIEQVTVVDEQISEEELAQIKQRAELRLASLFRQCAGKGESDALRLSIFRYRIGE